MTNRERILAYMRGDPAATEWAHQRLEEIGLLEPSHKPVQCFKGVRELGDDHTTSYPSIRHALVASQRQRGLTNTYDMRKLELESRRVA